MHLAVSALLCSWLFLAAEDLLGTAVCAAVEAVGCSDNWLCRVDDTRAGLLDGPDTQQCPLSALEAAESGWFWLTKRQRRCCVR
ncbi:hypothetical protein Y032_0135g1916 [Ancylostoma ceylanicum]|uniref:Secreted protein n=1 Tax=Ancylostoma ceylanicum TaxID=53326 RepID=A0A016T5S2_9BILA|nr:hypothetical protein Y032_0135g1916 [Ancylostoma ceylanicum]